MNLSIMCIKSILLLIAIKKNNILNINNKNENDLKKTLYHKKIYNSNFKHIF